MLLEKEINQKKFASPLHKLVVNLVYTGNWMEHQIQIYLKEFNLSPQQFNVLRILRGQSPKPVSVNLITERMLDKMSNASRLVEKLRQKGLVDRQLCEKDRRRVDVVITQKGLDLLDEIDKNYHDVEDKVNHLSENEISQLNNLLDKLRGTDESED